ncbi:MAG: HAMP domain-containing sensor histidine kinase [Planctomycetota bacterium]
MSLAWRILLLALLLNVVTVGSVQVAVHLAQNASLAERQQQVLASAQSWVAELERVYSPNAVRSAPGDAAVVRGLLTAASTSELYDDVVVTNGQPPYEVLYLNPLGAVHRNPDRFPATQIAAGMADSRSTPDLLAVADGFCYALRQRDQVVGYLWFKPKVRPALPAALPLWIAAAGVAASTLLFGAVLFWVTRRTIRRPLQAIGDAAAAVGRGRYDVHVPARQGVPELDPLVATFNKMAQEVADHTRTLEQAVRDAVEATRQKERALVSSSRLATIGTLAAGVAHEINNPIGGMQNAVLRLLQQKDLPEKQRVYLQLVQDGLQRIARTASRLLDFSPRPAASGRFAIGSAVDGARALVEHRLGKARVKLQVDVPNGLPQVHGDQHEIQQVMLNLLINSLDALEARGGGGTIAVRAHAEGGRVHLHVDDDGPGMDQALLGRVFDPFFSQKDRPDASGLGLFICYSIVRNHGGEITVDSRPGEGFRVHVVLPAA